MFLGPLDGVGCYAEGGGVCAGRFVRKGGRGYKVSSVFLYDGNFAEYWPANLTGLFCNFVEMETLKSGNFVEPEIV